MEAPKFHITHADGNEFDVVVQQPEMSRWDIERAVRGWPAQEDAWNLWSSFVTYKAAIRQARIDPNMPWDTWVDQTVKIELETTVDVDPTQTEVSPG